MPTERTSSAPLQTVDPVGRAAHRGAGRESTELLKQGVRFESMPPEYLVTRLAELKKEMLAAATRDARERALQMAQNAGSRIGRLRAARQGVFQVTRVASTEVSDYGVNDTSRSRRTSPRWFRRRSSCAETALAADVRPPVPDGPSALNDAVGDYSDDLAVPDIAGRGEHR
jgi:hypothetical protein